MAAVKRGHDAGYQSLRMYLSASKVETHGHRNRLQHLAAALGGSKARSSPGAADVQSRAAAARPGRTPRAATSRSPRTPPPAHLPPWGSPLPPTPDPSSKLGSGTKLHP